MSVSLLSIGSHREKYFQKNQFQSIFKENNFFSMLSCLPNQSIVRALSQAWRGLCLCCSLQAEWGDYNCSINHRKAFWHRDLLLRQLSEMMTQLLTISVQNSFVNDPISFYNFFYESFLFILRKKFIHHTNVFQLFSIDFLLNFSIHSLNSHCGQMIFHFITFSFNVFIPTKTWILSKSKNY